MTPPAVSGYLFYCWFLQCVPQIRIYQDPVSSLSGKYCLLNYVSVPVNTDYVLQLTSQTTNVFFQSKRDSPLHLKMHTWSPSSLRTKVMAGVVSRLLSRWIAAHCLLHCPAKTNLQSSDYILPAKNTRAVKDCLRCSLDVSSRLAQLFGAGVLLIVIYSELHTVFEITLKWPPHTSEITRCSALSCEIKQGGRTIVTQDLFTYICKQYCQGNRFSHAPNLQFYF